MKKADIDVGMTINGHPTTSRNFRRVLAKATCEVVREKLIKMLRTIGPDESGQRLKFTITGSTVRDLIVTFSGPKDLVQKARKMFDVV